MKKLPNSKIELDFSVSWKDWEKFLDVAVKEISEELKIDGFRPGKAPRNLVEQKVGKEQVLNQGAGKAVEKAYIEKIKKENIQAIGSPEIKLEEVKEGEDLNFKAVVAVMPEAEVEASFEKNIKKINEEYKDKKPEVKDEEIDKELEKLANSRVKLVTVRREAKKGDQVEVDFDVLVGGVPIENGASKNHPLVLGKGVFIPGFEDQVEGMKEGEEKEFELNFPEDYHKKDLAGKKATFKVKLNLVQERQTPEINDDFAASLGKFKNLEELKKSIRGGMENEAGHKIKNEKVGKYLDSIVEKTKVDLPEVLVQEETEKMLKEFEMQTQSMGMNLDQYLQSIKKNKEELKKDWRAQAEKRVISALALAQIVKMKNVEVPKEDIEKEMNKTLAYYKNVKDIEKNIDLKSLYQYTKNTMENEKVIQLLEKM